MKIDEFFEIEYLTFANYDVYRKLGSFIDGFKPTARKLIYTVDRNNIKDKFKLSSLVNKMSEECEFLHSPDSAIGVAVGLAQNFAGSNNINLLRPAGSFGTRTISRPAAARYIFTHKETVFDYIFNKNDLPILTGQEFEGTKIEPKFYVPIIPMLLVNGSEGPAVGFAQKIISRNPNEIIKYCKTVCEGKKYNFGNQYNKMYPYFKGFKGNIVWDVVAENWNIYGCFERTGQTTLAVTELPVGYDIEGYKAVLDKLEENKEISDYIDKSVENTFEFEIKVSREFTKKDDEWIFSKLKLIKKYSENFTCIGRNNEPVEFKNEQEILDAFIKIRLEYYEKRKQYLINKAEEDIDILIAKYKFIKNVTSEKIKIFKQPKDKIVEQIKSLNCKEFNKFDNYDFLLSMQIYSLTEEKMKEIQEDLTKQENKLILIKETSINDMWLSELKELEKALK